MQTTTLQKRLGNLLCVKSIVTLSLTAVFAYLAVTGRVTSHDFLTVFSVVIAFYFGTQSQKNSAKAEEKPAEKPGKKPAEKAKGGGNGQQP